VSHDVVRVFAHRLARCPAELKFGPPGVNA
jgi:hypothetical protein